MSADATTPLRVVGAGFGRTGTNSLKLALERLLGAPCHHMIEVFEHPEQIPLWMAAADGRPDWPTLLDGYAATIDWPSAAFWRELAAYAPDAVVLLSRRDSAEDWWRSATATILTTFRGDPEPPPPMVPWFETLGGLLRGVGIDPDDPAASMAAYDAHLERVRAEVPADRLLEWTTGDGWEPLCAALGVPVPDEPFPHVNTTDEFQARQRARRPD